jgi:hypothetical protein
MDCAANHAGNRHAPPVTNVNRVATRGPVATGIAMPP